MADDNHDAAEALSVLVATDGYCVSIACDGEKAVTMAHMLKSQMDLPEQCTSAAARDNATRKHEIHLK